jgi:hypothetical protein
MNLQWLEVEVTAAKIVEDPGINTKWGRGSWEDLQVTNFFSDQFFFAYLILGLQIHKLNFGAFSVRHSAEVDPFKSYETQYYYKRFPHRHLGREHTRKVPRLQPSKLKYCYLAWIDPPHLPQLQHTLVETWMKRSTKVQGYPEEARSQYLELFKHYSLIALRRIW